MSKRWTSSSLLASASKCTWPLAYNSNTFTEGALERGRPPWQDGICPKLKGFGSPWTGRGLDAVRHETHTLRDLALVAAHVGCGRRGPRASACKGALPLLYEKGRVMKIIKAKDYEDMSRKAANIISAQHNRCLQAARCLVQEGRRRLCRGQHLQPGRVSRPFARRSPELSLLHA